MFPVSWCCWQGSCSAGSHLAGAFCSCSIIPCQWVSQGLLSSCACKSSSGWRSFILKAHSFFPVSSFAPFQVVFQPHNLLDATRQIQISWALESILSTRMSDFFFFFKFPESIEITVTASPAAGKWKKLMTQSEWNQADISWSHVFTSHILRSSWRNLWGGRSGL